MLNSIKKYFKRVKEKNPKTDTMSSTGQGDETVSKKDETKMFPRGWIGVDLDGTLASYERRASYGRIGEPVPAMLELVQKMINNGMRVKIFTARADDPKQLPIIQKWLKNNGLPELEITNVKDYGMLRLYDDRCVQVEHNTGRLIMDN